MKKYFILFIVFLIGALAGFSQTATDFTASDCVGVSHHLFTELDAGKIIVVSFVEPCGSCIAPSLAAQTTVQGYASSYPGKVVFYVSDDQANTPCGSLTAWASTNGITSATVFSDVTFKESDYGAIAMPKIAVIGGTDHHIYFTQDGGPLNTTNLQNAINSAMAKLSVQKNDNSGFNLSVFPNPSKDRISLGYTLNEASAVSVDIYNVIGSKVLSVYKEKQPAGKNDLLINFNSRVCSGVYFLKLNAGELSESFKFIVDK
jgi:hypothetical protein